MKKIYTYDKCKELIGKYESIKQLKKENNSLLVVIRRNGWNELIENLKREIHKKYTIEDCVKTISKYNYLSDFSKENKSMIAVIYNNKWNYLLNNLKKSGSKYKRCIYAYEFVIEKIKYVYIGLTFNLEARDFKHRTDKKSTVYKFATDIGVSIPSPIQLTEYVDRQNASKLEGEYLKIYKNKNYIILNKRKTGTLGGNPNNCQYSKEICIKIAKNYKTITSFAKENTRAYQLIKLNKWENEAFSHMKKNKPSDYSTLKKKVIQYSINGEKIKEFDSISIASKETKVRREHISHCCNGKRKTCGGFIWKFKE